MSRAPARRPDPGSQAALRDAWSDLRERDPGIRPRAAADRLGVSEAELVATRAGNGVRRIRPDVEDLLPRLEALGPLLALTRNEVLVHEKPGVYRDAYVNPHVSSVVGDEIDLRIFPARWRHGFAVAGEARGRLRRSLQFFDGHGVAVHKIHLLESSDAEAYEAVVADLLHDDQSPGQEVEGPPPDEEPRPDSEVDVLALEQGWRELEDTHDFFGLLREHGVSRTQALRLVSDELARPAAPGALRRVLEAASEDGIELMVFGRSPGTLQIHHGPVEHIVETPPWLNVLDDGFKLHAREEAIGASWVVRKPVDAGWVTSVEIFDAHGDVAAYLFGCRSEGEPEDPGWRALAEGLP